MRYLMEPVQPLPYGELFKTKTGELTLRAQNIRLLVKSLEPPPEKFHGIADTETRYRRVIFRFPHLRRNAKFLCAARDDPPHSRIFYRRDYFEAETPILQPIPGGGGGVRLLQMQRTQLRFLSANRARVVHQTIARRRIQSRFELNRNFRNEGVSTRHNPEFTMLEFNAAYHTCEDFIGLTETLLNDVARTLHGGDVVRYQGRDLSFAPRSRDCRPPQPFCNTAPAIRRTICKTNRDCATISPNSEKRPPAAASVPELQFMLFEETAEPLLEQPTFIVDYPAAASPLARRRPRQSGNRRTF